MGKRPLFFLLVTWQLLDDVQGSWQLLTLCSLIELPTCRAQFGEQEKIVQVILSG